LQGNTGVQVLE